MSHLLKKDKKSAAELYELLKGVFGEEKIPAFVENATHPVITVTASAIAEVSMFLRDNEELLFDNLICLSGNDEEDGEKIKAEDGSTTINGGNLSVIYHIESASIGHKLNIKCLVPREEPTLPSVFYIWRCADWHEREAFDMYGIKFEGHPNLIRILMPYDWSFGYPLRKDYKNPEFYQGMKIPY